MSTVICLLTTSHFCNTFSNTYLKFKLEARVLRGRQLLPEMDSSPAILRKGGQRTQPPCALFPSQLLNSHLMNTIPR